MLCVCDSLDDLITLAYLILSVIDNFVSIKAVNAWPSECRVVLFIDFPSLRGIAVIEEARQRILSTFRAYTTGLFLVDTLALMCLCCDVRLFIWPVRVVREKIMDFRFHGGGTSVEMDDHSVMAGADTAFTHVSVLTTDDWYAHPYVWYIQRRIQMLWLGGRQGDDEARRAESEGGVLGKGQPAPLPTS